MPIHRNIGQSDNHPQFSLEYADAAARAGATLVAADIGRVARQLDDDTFWLLTTLTPSATWAQIAPGQAAHAATHESGGGDEVLHQNLTGAGANTHAVLDTHVASSANPHAVTKAQVGLTNVTDDAQLTRAAADFGSFAAKAAPVGADVVLLEDSEAGAAKKRALVSALGGGGAPTGASYLVLGLDGTLTAERRFVAGTGLSATDGGADGDYTLTADLSTGLAGGQTIKGGTAAGEDLTLTSTSHATKSKVIFGAAGASVYDEANDRLGLGTAAPATKLDVVVDDAVDSGVTNVLTLTHTTNLGGGDTGIGAGILVRGEATDSTVVDFGSLRIAATNATPAGLRSSFYVYLRNAGGALTQQLHLDHTGKLRLAGSAGGALYLDSDSHVGIYEASGDVMVFVANSTGAYTARMNDSDFMLGGWEDAATILGASSNAPGLVQTTTSATARGTHVFWKDTNANQNGELLGRTAYMSGTTPIKLAMFQAVVVGTDTPAQAARLDFFTATGGVTTKNLSITELGDIQAGAATVALVGDTSGYLYVRGCAGAPTGVPAGGPANMYACRYDSTNKKWWIYDAGWIGVGLA